MQNRLATVAALTLSLIATAASAEGVRTEKNMSLELANQIAAATVAACAANNYNVIEGKNGELGALYEIKSGLEKADFVHRWDEKYSGQVYDKSVEVTGKPGAPKTGAPAPKPAGATGMFKKKS